MTDNQQLLHELMELNRELVTSHKEAICRLKAQEHLLCALLVSVPAADLQRVTALITEQANENSSDAGLQMALTTLAELAKGQTPDVASRKGFTVITGGKEDEKGRN